MKRLVVLGPPGSGKGTNTQKIAKAFNLKRITVGDVVKKEISKKTKLGQLMFSYTKDGHFVPNDIVVKVLEKQVKNLKGFDGFIIDSAPINMEQKEIMKNWNIDCAIWLNIKDFNISKKRVLKRLMCPNCHFVTSKTENKNGICPNCETPLEKRYDDSLQVVSKRLNQYVEKTLPVVKSFKKEGKVLTINAEQDKEKVFLEICSKINKFFAKSL